MITPEIQEYVASCRAYGMSDEAIRESLLATGWNAAQVEAVFAHPTLEVAQLFEGGPVVRKPGKKRALVAALITVLILGGTGGVVSASEMGYMPAVSKVYRKTPIPLAWKGTTNDASLAMARALVENQQEASTKVETNFSLDFNFSGTPVQSFISRYQPQGSVEAGRLAAVPGPETMRLAFTVKALRGENGDVATSLDIPLNELSNMEELAPYLKEGNNTLSFESFIPAGKDAMYLRSKSLPTPTLTDLGKWFKIPTDLNALNAVERDRETKRLLSEEEEIMALRELINQATVDNGIIRKNGEARAWYVTKVDRDFVARQSENQKLPESWREALKESLKDFQNAELTVNWYMTPSQPILRELDMEFSGGNDSGTYVMKVDVRISDVTAQEVGTEPAEGKTWASYEDYSNALMAAYPNLYDTGIFSDEALEMFFMYVQPVPEEDALEGATIEVL